MELTNTATLKLGPQMHLFTLAHKKDMKHSRASVGFYHVVWSSTATGRTVVEDVCPVQPDRMFAAQFLLTGLVRDNQSKPYQSQDVPAALMNY